MSSSAREVVRMTTGMIASCRIRLDLGQYFATVEPGQVQVEQDQVRPPLPGLAQKLERRLAVV